MWSKIRKVFLFVLELIFLALLAFGVVKIVHRFVFQPFYILGPSMEPNFFNYDYLIINKISYRFNEIERGEVIVLKNPSSPASLIIKRVVGLPGEEIKIKEGKVFLYNKILGWRELEEPYLGVGTSTPGDLEITLASDEYFVMGDNRNVSLDSRSFGVLKKNLIVGRAWLRAWPFSSFGFIKEYPKLNN
ncbi:signal peptidase I [bacterium (Candidatus Moisslbacteria) CG02_land_8_20_14_3_00_36_53]|nr:MAG: signal peptidase I [bacterium (Candidatus Moisslbacteria) CG02_land_8_20_14_3_00_36_53]